MYNIEIKIKILLKELLKIHVSGLVLTFMLIFGFLIYKLGICNLNLFFKDWLIFNVILTLISMILIFIPLSVIKYIKIPLMLKNKKPIKIIQKINYVMKCLIGVAVITVIINGCNNLHELFNKKAENKIWDNALNYAKIDQSGVFSGSIGYSNSEDEKERIKKLDENTKQWFKICNEKGAIYINTQNLYNSGSEIKDKLHNYLQVNNNYLRVNPIYDVEGNEINIPDHDEYTLNLLVPESLRKYEKMIKKERSKMCEMWYRNSLPDYKFNVIYIKDNQKCFSYRKDFSLETQNYVIGSIIQVVSNNSMLMHYGSCCSSGFYPKVSNIDNIYQELLPDIKKCNVDNIFVGATTLYDIAAQDIYETEQQFFYTMEFTIFAIVLLVMLIISTSVNYLEQKKIENVVKRLNGVGFLRRSIKILKPILLTWWISILIMLILNYNRGMISKIIELIYIPYEMALIEIDDIWYMFSIKYVKWGVVVGVILLDIIMTLTILRVYEKKKGNEVIKGE